MNADALSRADIGADFEIETLDLNEDEMPIFNPKPEAEDNPKQAHDFYAKIGAADGLNVSLTEYNGSYTAAFKSIFDWISRIKECVFQDQPKLLVATLIGPWGGNWMVNARGGFPHFGASIASSFHLGRSVRISV